MDTPIEDPESERPKDENDETKSASEVESYESEWYQVLKRRAEELEGRGEPVEGDGEEELEGQGEGDGEGEGEGAEA